ncbi:MAG: hypothetical protein WD767_16880 [Alphaproteobacteria bacterium]
MDAFEPSKPGPVQDTGPILFLGLFLLLLAFFILLNALATREEIRTRAVINSLILTFQAPEQETPSKEVFISALAPVPEPEDLVDEFERLWVASIPLLKVTRLSQGRTMEVNMPTNEFFVGPGAGLRADRVTLFVNTARALAFKSDGFVNELEFVFGVEKGLRRSGESVQVVRAAAIARELIANGAPPDTVTVGTQWGEARQIRMRFHVRDESKAYVDFGEYATQGTSP